MAGKTDSIIAMNAEDERIAKRHRLCRGAVSTVDGVGVAVREVVTPAESIREAYGKGKYPLLFVGELSSRKNQAFLIKALPKIKERIPNAVLWLVGDGSERERLLALAEGLGIADSVAFLGKRADACDFMRASALYVSAAKIEGLPFNIVEALGCGKYVVASDIKGHADVINSARVGLLYPLNDMKAFTEAVTLAYEERHCNEKEALERYSYFEKTRVFPLVLQTIVYNLNKDG